MAALRKLCTPVLLLAIVVTSQLARPASHSPSTDAQAWEALKDGSAIIIMRHALAPGMGDPSEFTLDSCDTQRNLSAQGRLQAEAIGNVLRAQGIAQATILSSQWCRCIDTAELLGFGKPKTYPVINSFFQNRSTAKDQTQTLSKQLNEWVMAPDKLVRILVTHQVNISALTDTFANSGDMLIVTMANKQPKVLARINTELE